MAVKDIAMYRSLRQGKRSFAAAVATLALIRWAAPALGAEVDEQLAAQASSGEELQVTSAALDEIRRLVTEQQRLIESQAQRLDALERELRQARTELAAVAERPGSALPADVEQRLAAV